MLLFVLTPDHAASVAHTSLPENGNITIELQFSRPLPEAITCLLYLEYDSTVLINFSRSHNRFLMDTWQILCTLRDVTSFLNVFPSYLLPSSRSILKPCTLIVNADTEGGSHWLAIRLTPRYSTAYYFDSYGIFPLVPSIQAFLKHNCTIWEYNKRQLQGLTSEICGQYCCCLLALFMDRGYTPQQFITLFAGSSNADRQVTQMFASEFGATLPRGGWGQCCRSCI
jgi:hypothetical protein